MSRCVITKITMKNGKAVADFDYERGIILVNKKITYS